MPNKVVLNHNIYFIFYLDNAIDRVKIIFGLVPDLDSNPDPNPDPKLTAGRILSRIRNKHFRSATLEYFVYERIQNL
jgi:hypothetical protein